MQPKTKLNEKQHARHLAPRFELGHVLATPGALAACSLHGVAPLHFIARHAHGDWGQVCEEDRQQNEAALADGSRLLSSYELPMQTGQMEARKVWVITEADRSATTLLLPSEY